MKAVALTREINSRNSNNETTKQSAIENKQEIWANAHEMRDSISLMSYAGCLNLSAVILAKIHSLSARCSLK